MVPTHVHAWANFCVAVSGGFSEITQADATDCAADTCVFRPREHAHSNRFGADGGLCVNLEIENGPYFERPAFFHSRTVGREVALLRREMAVPQSASLIAEGLVSILLGRLEGLGPMPEPRPPRWLLEVRDKLTEEFRGNHALSELAVLASVHPVHLSREFHRFFGCSTGDYLRRRRLQYARRLLANSAVPIAQIAHEAGFADQAHLTRSFRAAFGTTPLRARRERFQ